MTSRQTNIHHFASTQASGGGSVRGMHQIGYAIVILAAALYGLLFAQPAFAQSGMISGTVTDSANNPIENITVELYQESFTPIFGTMWSSVSYTNTATSGNFAFPGLDAGKYRLYIYDANSTPRYQNEYFDNAADLDSATDINLAANENRSNIAVQLANLGSISGRVTIPGGGPLPNAQINLYTYATCCAYWAQFSTYAADANGDYTLPGLPTGTYRIGVYDSSYPSMYQAEFYQDAADVESATDIPVGDGEDVTGIDVELAKFGTISGRVLDTNSAPLANISIQIYGNDPCCGWIPIYSVSTNPSGYYTVTGLISGTYRVEFIDNNIPTMFQSEYYDSVATLAAAADVVVTTGQDVINVDAVLAKLGSISGSVTDDGNRPLSMIQVYAYALDSQNCCGAWSAQTDAEGHFIILGLPSERIKFTLSITLPFRHSISRNISTM
ncbi:MAG: carboxypeptidase-like regulatory domain-containing protein [Caldilineaceae bacterium]